ncbi:MAG: hypothetical protein LBS45_02205 [Synergistaceae bacterium]|jgi:hypothetical protein|nr:hypothetical protein [Synergistaceae bacterium]
MAEEGLYCESCESVMAPDWSLPYCPVCGGKVGHKILDKPESAAAADSASKKRDKPQDAKLNEDSGENDAKNSEQLRSEAFDELKQASPVSIFTADILTLGLRSTLWMLRWMGSLEGMARQDERHGRRALYLCFVLYTAVMALIALTCRELYGAGWNNFWSLDFWGLGGMFGDSIFPRAAACLFPLFFLMNRHILFWAREVIADAIQMENADTINTKTESFAPSPFLLWFIGVPYLQFHLNEIVRARNLANFKSSKRRPS